MIITDQPLSETGSIDEKEGKETPMHKLAKDT